MFYIEEGKAKFQPLQKLLQALGSNRNPKRGSKHLSKTLSSTSTKHKPFQAPESSRSPKRRTKHLRKTLSSTPTKHTQSVRCKVDRDPEGPTKPEDPIYLPTSQRPSAITSLNQVTQKQFSPDYNGPREAADTTKYKKSQVGAASKETIIVTEVEAILGKSDAVMSESEAADSTVQQTFVKTTTKHGECYILFHTNTDEVITKLRYKKGVVLFKPKHLQNNSEGSSVAHSFLNLEREHKVTPSQERLNSPQSSTNPTLPIDLGSSTQDCEESQVINYGSHPNGKFSTYTPAQARILKPTSKPPDMSTLKTRSQLESHIPHIGREEKDDKKDEEKEPKIENVSEEHHGNANLEGRLQCYNVMNVIKNVAKFTCYKCYEVYLECYKVYRECYKVCKEAQCKFRCTYCYYITTEVKETREELQPTQRWK